MARPRLSLSSFLAHVFAPKKNPQPTGLRRSTLKPTAGRRRARVNAFNKMTTVKQQILSYSGAREQYLRGEVTFTQAKQSLRNDAVERSIVKPLRREYGTPNPRTFVGRTEMKRRIADNVWNKTKDLEPNSYQARRGQRRANKQRIYNNIFDYLEDSDIVPEMMTWDVGDIQMAAKGYEVNGKRYVIWQDNAERSPFWYH